MSVKLTIKDRGYDRLKREMTRSQPVEAAVGWPEQGSGPEVHDAQSGLSNASLATIHEFGTGDGHIPERGALRKAFAAKQAEVLDLLSRGAGLFFDGRARLEAMLQKGGQLMAAEVQRFIDSGLAQPPNAPATIARKGSSTPLIHTDVLVSAVEWVVRKAVGR